MIADGGPADPLNGAIASTTAQVVGDRLEAFFVLAVTTGLRRGELLGLRWSDVDTDAKVLFVRQTLQRVGGYLQVVAPKTHRSTRPVPLAQLACDALARHRDLQHKERTADEELWRDSGLVFANTLGGPMEPRNVNRRFELVRKAAGLPWLRLHDLRHAFATFLLHDGQERRTVMDPTWTLHDPPDGGHVWPCSPDKSPRRG